MPEGDTVHRAARRLDDALSAQVLTRSDLRIPSLATRDLAGRRVLETVSRGKHLLTRFEGGVTLHSHLKMDGSWDIHPVGTRWRKAGHLARAVLRTQAVEAVGFQVLLDLVATEREDSLVGHLGPDLLGPDWDAEQAMRNLAGAPEARLGDALLDQSNLAGIGNVFRVELCFLAGADPATSVGALPRSDLEGVLAHAKRLLETNKDRSRRNTTGDPRNGRQLWVYNRRGPCLRCGTAIRTDTQGPRGRERQTWWCPQCQPMKLPQPG